MKDKFIKNGVFSLEYDKETLRDMVLELQEENQELKAELQLYQGALKREHEAIHRVNELEEVIDKAIDYVENEMPYLQETDKEYEDVNGNTYFTYKEYDGKELIEILKGVE